MSSKATSCHVLLVEDDEDDFMITRDVLAQQDRVRFYVEWSDTYEAGLQAIREQRHEVYIIDYRLGGKTGLDLVREAFAERPRAPVILLTGQSDLTIDLEASALGVTDFLVKTELTAAGLERSIRYAITHHQALHDLASSEERYALAVRAANDGLWDWDLPSGRIYYSPRWYEILGLPDLALEEDLDRWLSLVHPEDLLRVQAAVDDHLSGKSDHLEVEHRMGHAKGGWRWVLNRGLAIRAESGEPSRMAGAMADITDRRLAEEQLQHDALHDALTGLPNRALFMDRLGQLLQRARRDPVAKGAVLFLDMDRFKLVNDSFSHIVGDQLLVAVAARIAAVLRPGDTIARLGGDEFTVLLDGVSDDDEALVVAERIQEALRGPVMAGEHEIFVTASIGVALTTPGIRLEDVVRNADIAMYDAKRRGGARTSVFDQSMHQQAVARMSHENELRLVLEQSLLEIHFQPIVDLVSGRIRFVEALARWPSAWNDLRPDVFIPIAEEAGMISELGRQVLRGALQVLAGWRSAGVVDEQMCISVNVSARQIDDPGLPGELLAAIEEAGVPGSAVRLEITESMLIHEPDQIERLVAEVCATGVGLHLDDYGTGYSSLSALHQFPVDTLKIDRDFIGPISESEDGGHIIVRSTIALGHGLGLEVVGEGIENAVQVGVLRELGCDYGQGFLFGAPMPADELEAVLAQWSPEAAAALGRTAPA